MEESDDFALALQLQAQFDEELASGGQFSDSWSNSANSGTVSSMAGYTTQASDTLNTSMPLTDERWEMLDPNPDARALFLQFNDRFFWGKLAGVEVRWSPRMTL